MGSRSEFHSGSRLAVLFLRQFRREALPRVKTGKAPSRQHRALENTILRCLGLRCVGLRLPPKLVCFFQVKCESPQFAQVRRHLLDRHVWLLACGGDEPLVALRCTDGDSATLELSAGSDPSCSFLSVGALKITSTVLRGRNVSRI